MKVKKRHQYFIFISDASQSWILEKGQLKDKANIWQSTDKFDITNKGEFVYIEKILEEILIETEPENSAVKNNNQKNIKKRVLGYTGNNGPTVLPQDFEDTPGQLWKKGEVNTEGYFTLVNSDKKHKSPKFLTAISASVLEIKGTHF